MEYKSEIISNIKYYFDNEDNDNINKLVNLIIEYNHNNIFFIGIGKSKNVCLHFSDLLNCININAIVLDSSNLLHGNMGCFKKDDLIIAISKSGNTNELSNIISIIKKKYIKIILLSSKQGNIGNIVDETFIVPMKDECTLCWSIMPTNSILSFIIYINKIIGLIIQKEKIDKHLYIKNHFSGDIGFAYRRIKDCIIKKEHCSILNNNNTLKDAIIDMNLKEIGITIIKNNNEIKGIITNRDICLFLEKNNNLLVRLSEIMKTNFKFLEDVNMYMKDIPEKNSFIPIIKDGNLLGVIPNS